MQKLDKLIEFYEALAPESVGELDRLYAPDAYFKDPFNEVHGPEAIGQIFRHMFSQVADPRFIIIERIAAENGAVLVWEFRFRMRHRGLAQAQTIRGITHLRFDAEDRVVFHRDYWDAAEELYSKLPLLGSLMRVLQRCLRA
jgi:limonene-1,2-epoxide hydrolase